MRAWAATRVAECDEVGHALTAAASAAQAGRSELGARVAAAVERTRRAEQRALQGRRVEAPGRLAGAVAHDFNNLVGVFSNSAHLMRRQTPALPEAQAQRFEVVLSDIVMPGAMDGATLTRALRRRWPLLPVVLTSGHSTRTPPAGQFLALHKPCSQAELVAALPQAMAPAT